MPIKNEATIKDNNEVNINRAAIEHRATWMGLIYDEAVKAGADAEAICRKAIKRCGQIHGANYFANRTDPEDVRAFEKSFLNDLGKKTFEMDVTACDENNLKIEFHYCPLLSAWQKLGFDDATYAKLCDIAMEGDRGIASKNNVTLDLGNTIAQGNCVCNLHFHK